MRQTELIRKTPLRAKAKPKARKPMRSRKKGGASAWKKKCDFRELDDWRAAPVICDNNLLASSRRHFLRVIKSLKPFPACDFNQGLDARLFAHWHAMQIAALNHPMVRFAFDHRRGEEVVCRAVAIAKNYGIKRVGVYVLIGFGDTPDDARYRLEKVREWGAMPNPMRYQPLDATKKNSYVDPNWTRRELARMTRYYSRLVHLGHIPYDEYQPVEEGLFV